MSVSAAPVKTMAAQNPASGVPLSRNHRHKGIITTRPIVSRFGMLKTSCVIGRGLRRRFRPPLGGFEGGEERALTSASRDEHGAFADERHEPALRGRRLLRRQR